jgi:hypothetical protein
LAVLLLGLAGTAFLFAVREAWYGRLSLSAILKLGLLFHVLVLFLPLLVSEDVYQYAMYGRIAGIHHANPYVTPPSSFPGDAFLPLTNPGWRGLTSPYGPGLVLLARLVTALTAHPPTVVLIFKLVAGASSVATMFVVANLARARWPSRAAFATALIALNPAVLFVVVGSGHSDALVAVLVAVALRLRVQAIEERRLRGDLAATACLTLAMMIKPPLLILLVAFIAMCMLQRARADRVGSLAAHLGVAAGVALPLAIPFLGVRNPLGGVAWNFEHGYFLSPSSFIDSALLHFQLLKVHLLAVILTRFFRAAFLLALVAALIMVVRLVARNRSWQGDGAAYGWILLVSILASPQVRPWYIVWILPVAWLLPTLPRLTTLASSALLPLFVSVAPEFFPDLYDALVYVGLGLVAPVLLLALWLLIKDLIMRTKIDVPLWRDLRAPPHVTTKELADVGVG